MVGMPFLYLQTDAENYENVEEVACMSPGAARLIAGNGKIQVPFPEISKCHV